MSNRTSVADLLHSTITAWIVLTCSLLLTLLGWYITDAYARQRALDRFDFKVEEARLAITKRMQEHEQLLPGADGEPRHHAIHIVAERGTDGRPVSVLAVGRDPTGQKADEERLRLAASVFQNSSEGVFFTDTETTSLSVNPAFCEITGYNEEEVVGRT